jgi:hypothetical protein
LGKGLQVKLAIAIAAVRVETTWTAEVVATSEKAVSAGKLEDVVVEEEEANKAELVAISFTCPPTTSSIVISVSCTTLDSTTSRFTLFGFVLSSLRCSLVFRGKGVAVNPNQLKSRST